MPILRSAILAAKQCVERAWATLRTLVGSIILAFAYDRPQTPLAIDPRRGEYLALILSRLKDWLGNVARIPSGLMFGVLLGLLFFGSVSVASLVEGAFLFSSKTTVTFIKDVAAPVHFGLLNPLVIVLILKYYERLSGIFANLERYVDLTEDQKSHLIRRIQSLYQRKWVVFSAILLLLGSVAGVFFFFYFRHRAPVSYYIFVNGVFSVSGVLTYIWATVITYFIAVAGLKSVTTIFAMRAAFAYPIRYQTLHSDGRAGLGEIGNLLTHLVLVITFVGLTISMFFISDILHLKDVTTFRVLTASVVYVAVAPFLVIVPLWHIHLKMKAAKNDCLTMLASRYRSNSLEAITAFYAAAKELPEWPIRMAGVPTLAGC